MKKFSRGFTLIELLVVIAIIGILSSVVLASLNTARGKGSDAAIKSNIDSMRAQAELVYDGVGSYDTVCNGTQDANVAKALAAIVSVGAFAGTETISLSYSTLQTNILVSCHATSAGWAISAPLKSTANTYWCADSTGTSKQTTTPLAASSVVCL